MPQFLTILVSFQRERRRDSLVSTELLLPMWKRRIHHVRWRRPLPEIYNFQCRAREPASSASWTQRREGRVLYVRYRGDRLPTGEYPLHFVYMNGFTKRKLVSFVHILVL